MNLQKMHDLLNAKSYYSRANNDAEVWAAISEAGRRIHQAVCKEFRGYWIKWDTASIVFTGPTAPNTANPPRDEYQCPIDLGQMIRFSERTPGELAYRRMEPADITTDLFFKKQFESILSANCGPSSEYVYYGPYLDQTDATINVGPKPAPQYYKVKIAPPPVGVRQTEVIYAARYIEIESSASPNVIPMEGHGCQLDWAVMELVKANNDSLAGQYDKSGNDKLAEFLTWVRSRQIQEYPVQETYLDDLD